MIPSWIQNILDHPHLMQSFIEDMERQKKLSEQEGLKCIEKGNMAKAQIALGKVKAFEAMIFSIKSIIKEREAQNVHMEQRSGKATKSTKR